MALDSRKFTEFIQNNDRDAQALAYSPQQVDAIARELQERMALSLNIIIFNLQPSQDESDN